MPVHEPTGAFKIKAAGALQDPRNMAPNGISGQDAAAAGASESQHQHQHKTTSNTENQQRTKTTNNIQKLHKTNRYNKDRDHRKDKTQREDRAKAQPLVTDKASAARSSFNEASAAAANVPEAYPPRSTVHQCRCPGLLVLHQWRRHGHRSSSWRYVGRRRGRHCRLPRCQHRLRCSREL